MERNVSRALSYNDIHSIGPVLERMSIAYRTDHMYKQSINQFLNNPVLLNPKIQTIIDNTFNDNVSTVLQAIKQNQIYINKQNDIVLDGQVVSISEITDAFEDFESNFPENDTDYSDEYISDYISNKTEQFKKILRYILLCLLLPTLFNQSVSHILSNLNRDIDKGSYTVLDLPVKTVQTENLRIRKLPRINSGVKFNLEPGDKIKILSKKRIWMEVEYYHKNSSLFIRGWMLKTNLKYLD